MQKIETFYGNSQEREIQKDEKIFYIKKEIRIRIFCQLSSGYFWFYWEEHFIHFFTLILFFILL